MAKTWIYAASAAAIGGALIGGWLLVTWRPQRSGLIRSFVTPARGLAQM